jgi:hypothetical protein
VTTVSRVLAYGLGALLLAGLVILGVAGVPAARAIVVTGVAVLVMIVLGGAFRGRRRPGRPPAPGAPEATPGPGPGPGAAGSGGTMER